MANGSGARGERVSARLGGGAREREVRGLPGGDGCAESRGFIVSGGLRAPRGPGGSREETLSGALQWGGGGREQHRGEYLRGDAPEPQEQLSDIRLVQPAGLEVGPELAGLASFRVWKVDTQAPSELCVKLHSDSREIREHPNSGLGMVGRKTGAVGGPGWSDAGASRRIRDLTSFSEERGPLELLVEKGCQGGMLRGSFGGKEKNWGRLVAPGAAARFYECE